MDLEEATIEQIAEELRRRTTFRGVLAWQHEYKEQDAENWHWIANNCSPAEVARQLGGQLPE